MAKNAVFNPRRRPRLLRTHIPVSENITTLALAGLLALTVIWFFAQKDNYNPADRDVSAELLRQASTGAELYTPPLKRWSATASVGAAPDLDPFPPAVVDPDWRPLNPPRRFGPDNLFEKINGEAPKFLKQGFQALYYLVLKSEAAGELAVELFDQTDLGGSLGVFAEHLTADKTVEKQNGVTFFRTSIGAIGRTGRYFFRISGDAASDAVRAKAHQLTLALAALAQQQAAPATAPASDAGPPEMRLLQTLPGIAPELITFQKENVFQYDFASEFWFGKFSQDSPARVFLHRADSPEQASELLALILQEHGYEYATLEQTDRRALLRHEFLNTYFAIAQQGSALVGIENVADTDRAKAVLDQLTGALDDG